MAADIWIFFPKGFIPSCIRTAFLVYMSIFWVEGSNHCHADWCNYNEYCCGYDMCCDYLTDYWYLWLTMGLLFFFLILVCCWLRYHRQHSKESTEGRYVPLPGAFVKYGDEYYIPQQPPQVPFAREPPHFTETREFESQQYDSSRFYPPPYNFIERTPSAPPEGL